MDTVSVESHKVEWVRGITEFLHALEDSKYVEIKVLDRHAYAMSRTTLQLTDEQVESIRTSVYAELLKEVMDMLPEPEKSEPVTEAEDEPQSYGQLTAQWKAVHNYQEHPEPPLTLDMGGCM